MIINDEDLNKYKINNIYAGINDRFDDKTISLYDLINDYQEVVFELETKQEEIDDLNKDIEDNYKPIRIDDEFDDRYFD